MAEKGVPPPPPGGPAPPAIPIPTSPLPADNFTIAQAVPVGNQDPHSFQMTTGNVVRAEPIDAQVEQQHSLTLR